MAVNYATATKTVRMLATRDDVANGTLEIGVAGMGAVLATYGLNTLGGTVSGDLWTLGFDATTVAASNSGNAGEAQIKDAGGTVKVSGLTVGLSGTDIIIAGTSVAITVGQDVQVTSATIQHAA